MKARQRRIYSFDTRSVMLFAALSLGGAGVMHSQAHAQTSSSSRQSKPASSTTSSAAHIPIPIGSPSAPANAATSTLDRADASTDR